MNIPNRLLEKDKNGVPVHINDLIKVHHFTAANRRKVYMYKKVLIINNKVHAVSVEDLGVKDTPYCHRCYLKDCEDFEVIEGDCYDHPVHGWLVCWWERKLKRNQ